MSALGAALVFSVSAYSVGCDARPGSLTASGVTPVTGWTVAADPRVLPLGSIVHIDGVGIRMIQDRGGKVRGRRLDLYVETCQEARAWGRRARRVQLLHLPERTR